MRAEESYLIAWTTYGTWQYDGWAIGVGKVRLTAESQNGSAVTLEPRLSAPVVLDSAQRRIVEDALCMRCRLRRWTLHAARARSNHVRLVVTADCLGLEVVADLQTWCARRLNEQRPTAPERLSAPGHRPLGAGKRWWAEQAEMTDIPDKEYLTHAIRYVTQG